MPSQEEYLDNLVNENTEEPQTAPEESVSQIDMSDMDDLLQSALDAGQESQEKEAAAEETPDTDTAVHPEETAAMSEDEIDRLLQKSQEQPDNTAQQDANDELIRMLENADEEGLSNLLDQVTPESASQELEPEQAQEAAENEGKRGKRKKKKEKKEKVPKDKPGFFDRFKKKSKEETATEEPEDVASLGDTTENVEAANPEPENVEAAVPEMENPIPEETVADNGTTGGMDDGLDALLADAFPEKPEEPSEVPEAADVMDILKAAGADIVEEPEQKKEKKGFFAKLLDLFTEEDEEEQEADQLQLSDENKKILEEMDKGGKKKKGKKEKKPKKEKQPKPKKPAKEKKKKEKPEKEDKPAVPEKKLSPKKIIPIVVVCISLGAVILIVGNFLTDYTAKRSGREAYYAGDYQTCYQNLMGKELDETEQVMYSQSESILTIRMWLREYEVFVNEGSELEALDSLLQAIRDYPTLLDYATQWNAQDEVSAEFQDILNILSQKYELSQEEAQSIAAISDNLEYTKNVMIVLQKLGLGSWEFPAGTTAVTDKTPAQSTEEAAAQLPDPLPEEKEIQQ